ncbi:hypothetical protein QNZ93_004363 [Vibrio parahaemolyticus]|uniref:hypothetical protein n=1 Tax=Vibrio diabolicus TaxID=50719 RepID=UPI0028104879|nr:hypothetical protein [Vibrio parahaemolyticus]
MSKQIRVVSVGFQKNQPYLCEIKCHKDEQERPVVDGFRFMDASKVFNDDWKANLLALIGDDHAVVSSHGCGCFIYEFLRCKVKTQNVFIPQGETIRFASARVKLLFELAELVASDTGHDIKRELVAINGKGQWTIHKPRSLDAIALSTAFAGLKRLIPLSDDDSNEYD